METRMTMKRGKNKEHVLASMAQLIGASFPTLKDCGFDS